MSNTSKSWAIIGGGPHGVHAAIRLLNAGVPAGNIQIFDPHAELLANWRHCTEATGMGYLRSPVVHHLDIDPYALAHFAKSREARGIARFVPPYRRPGLRLFQAHCASLVAQYRLAERHCPTTVTAVEPFLHQWRIVTDRASVIVDSVILAPGGGASLERPPWAQGFAPEHVAHLFDARPAWRKNKHPSQRIVVVGGGISAAQTALDLALRHHVTLVRRHGPRVHLFDSDPGWVGPLHMRGFSACKDLTQRRTMISQARHRGSMPPELARKLQCKVRLGVLRVVEDEVQTANAQGSAINLTFKGQNPLVADHVLLATGMMPGRPGGALVDKLVTHAALPVSPCGFPILSDGLQWHPGLFIMGGLAELQLGPTSRNLTGAREAATRIVGSALART